MVPAGAPADCLRVAQSPALTGLSPLLDAMAAAGGSNPDAAADLRQSAADLRVLADGVAESLAELLVQTADALDLVAEQGITDPTAVQSLSAGLDALGTEVQARCDFPLG